MSLCDNPGMHEKVNLYEKLRALYRVAWELKAKGPWIQHIEKTNVEAMKGAHALGPKKLRKKYYSG